MTAASIVRQRFADDEIDDRPSPRGECRRRGGRARSQGRTQASVFAGENRRIASIDGAVAVEICGQAGTAAAELDLQECGIVKPDGAIAIEVASERCVDG